MRQNKDICNKNVMKQVTEKIVDIGDCLKYFCYKIVSM